MELLLSLLAVGVVLGIGAYTRERMRQSPAPAHPRREFEGSSSTILAPLTRDRRREPRSAGRTPRPLPHRAPLPPGRSTHVAGIGTLAFVESVQDVARNRRRSQETVVAITTVAALFYAALALATTPRIFSVVFLLLSLLCVAIVVRPVIGVYATLLLALAGDTAASPWYPFVKNFSSRESILFVADWAVINPIEIVLGLTTFVWLLARIGDSTWSFRRPTLTRPMLVFVFFVLVGLVFGLVNDGNVVVAVFEVRPLLYLPVLYLLIVNLLTTERDFDRLLMVSMAGISIHSIFALRYYFDLPAVARAELQDLGEHAASIHSNAYFILIIAVFAFGAPSRRRRTLLLLGSMPIVMEYVLAQRRSAAVALGIGIVLLCVLLFWKRRAVATWLVPLVVACGVAYLAVFWNSTGGLGAGAQAVKSYIAPDSLSAIDQSSDAYREIEARNIWFTIQSNELFGVGFGRPFLRPFPLPDLSFFVFVDYLPHNGVLWIWLKTGVLGFATMLTLILRTIRDGAAGVLSAVSSARAAMCFTALAYVVMYMVFAFVDIAWDIRSCVFLALSLAICADLPRSDPSELSPALDERRMREVRPSL